MRRAWVDANVLLRHLTGDPPDLAKKACAVMEEAQNGKILLRVSPLVVAEVVWVLGSYYGYGRAQIAEAIATLLAADGIEAIDRDLILGALQVMAEKNVDFVDAVLAGMARAVAEPVVTFDEDFRKLGRVVLGRR